MSILAAVAGNAQNIIFSGGLYVVEQASVDQSPITASASNTNVTRNWIGYFLSPTTGTVTLSIQTTRSAGGGGSASTTGRLWLGTNAPAGSNDTANILATNNQTSSVNFSLTQGVHYPLRIRWTGSYVVGFFGAISSGSITFFSGGSSSVSGQIFYNSLTNGF